jgi:diguanylate cyclase (GGDEF)-like protein
VKKVRKDFRNLFWIAFLFPYLFIALILFFLIAPSIKDLYELKTVEDLYVPLKLVGKLNFNLNNYKFYLITGQIRKAQTCKEHLNNDLQKLFNLLKENPKWIEYCKCGNIFNFENELLTLESKIKKEPYNVFLKINRLSQFLDSYYLNLNSHIENIKLKTFLVSIVFSNSFYRNLTSLAIQNYFYLVSRNPNYFYNLYFYKGKVESAEYFLNLKLQTFSQNLSYPIGNFLPNLEKTIYKNRETLIEDFENYARKYKNFNKKLFDFLENKVHSIIKSEQLKVITATSLAVASLILILWLDYIVTRLPLKFLQNQLEKYKGKIYRDALTDLLNRRAFGLMLYELSKDKKPFSLILFDIDNFKKINDTYGHVFGDKVLKFLSDLVKKHLRKGDLAFRWGGEEFAIIVFDDKNTAYKIAERLRKAVENADVDGVKFTVSFGVGEYKGEPIKEFLNKVDAALYEAKRKGKNRVELAAT